MPDHGTVRKGWAYGGAYGPRVRVNRRSGDEKREPTMKRKSQKSESTPPTVEQARIAAKRAETEAREAKEQARLAKSNLKAARKAFKGVEKAAKRARKEARRARKKLETLLARQADLKKRPAARRGSLHENPPAAKQPTVAAVAAGPEIPGDPQ